MSDRLILYDKLNETFPNLKIYFRPSSKLNLQYPCIVYDVSTLRNKHADNNSYSVGTRFQVTVMSVVPGVDNIKDMFDIPRAQHIRSFTNDDIVHDIFHIEINTL